MGSSRLTPRHVLREAARSSCKSAPGKAYAYNEFIRRAVAAICKRSEAETRRVARRSLPSSMAC